jgi:hypothetical protein
VNAAEAHGTHVGEVIQATRAEVEARADQLEGVIRRRN